MNFWPWPVAGRSPPLLLEEMLTDQVDETHKSVVGVPAHRFRVWPVVQTQRGRPELREAMTRLPWTTDHDDRAHTARWSREADRDAPALRQRRHVDVAAQNECAPDPRSVPSSVLRGETLLQS